jgi:hypothetical protein
LNIKSKIRFLGFLSEIVNTLAHLIIAKYPFFSFGNCKFLGFFVLEQYGIACKEAEFANNISIPIEQAKIHAEKTQHCLSNCEQVMNGHLRADFFETVFS